jgi:hypothetical protein
MPGWSPDFENDLTQLLKEWLKSQGRTQADLRRSLRAASTRLPSILEVLERDYKAQGTPRTRVSALPSRKRMARRRTSDRCQRSQECRQILSDN